MVKLLGRAAGEDIIPAFGEDSAEAEGGRFQGEIVVVDKLGVAEDLRVQVEKAVDGLAVEVHLGAKFIGRIEGGEGVVVGLREELDIAGGGEPLEERQDVGGVAFELFEGGAGDGEGDAELARVALDELKEEGGGGTITSIGDAREDAGVGFLVEVGGGRVEDAVTPETVGLMDLKVETDGAHACMVVAKRRGVNGTGGKPRTRQAGRLV